MRPADSSSQLRHDGVDEVEPERRLGVEAVSGQEQIPRRPRPDRAQHVGRDDGGRMPSLTSAKADTVPLPRSRCPPPRRGRLAPPIAARSVRENDHGLRAGVDRAQHVSHLFGVGLVLAAGVAARAAHPSHVGAGAKDRHRPDRRTTRVHCIVVRRREKGSSQLVDRTSSKALRASGRDSVTRTTVSSRAQSHSSAIGRKGSDGS